MIGGNSSTTSAPAGRSCSIWSGKMGGGASGLLGGGGGGAAGAPPCRCMEGGFDRRNVRRESGRGLPLLVRLRQKPKRQKTGAVQNVTSFGRLIETTLESGRAALRALRAGPPSRPRDPRAEFSFPPETARRFADRFGCRSIHARA